MKGKVVGKGRGGMRIDGMRCVEMRGCDAMRWVAVKLTKNEKISNRNFTK